MTKGQFQATGGTQHSGPAALYSGMPGTRVKSPKQTLKVHRRGDTVRLTATVTRVDDDEDDPRRRRVTVTIPGYPIPITLSEATLLGEDG